jgi:hypothetical protein
MINLSPLIPKILQDIIGSNQRLHLGCSERGVTFRLHHLALINYKISVSMTAQTSGPHSSWGTPHHLNIAHQYQQDWLDE